MKHTNKGFTLVELLVVVAIIGLLAGIAVVSVNSVRVKARDAKRIADVKQIQNALELYNNTKGGAYPPASAPIVLANQVISETNGIAATGAGEIYINVIPDDPTTGQDYTYLTCGAVGASRCDNYVIQFKTEAAASVGAAGYYCANTTGIAASASPASSTTLCTAPYVAPPVQ